MVKNLSAVYKTWVQSLGQEDPLENRMTTHSCILAWKTPWTEQPKRLQFMESQSVGHTESTFTSILNKTEIHRSGRFVRVNFRKMLRMGRVKELFSLSKTPPQSIIETFFEVQRKIRIQAQG